TFTGSATMFGTVGPNTAYTVVGVMPRSFQFPDEAAEFWTPMALSPPADGQPRRVRSMMARLGDSVTADAAAADVATIIQDVRGTALAPHGDGRQRFELVRVQDEITSPVKPALTVLTIAVAFVLLIASANVANLLLACTAARQRELAVRMALGAGRGRLIRQMLTESLML